MVANVTPLFFSSYIDLIFVWKFSCESLLTWGERPHLQLVLYQSGLNVPLATSQALICLVDKKTGDKSKTRPRFVKQDQVCIARLRTAGTICLETFKDFPQMGRFTLRDEGEWIFSPNVIFNLPSTRICSFCSVNLSSVNIYSFFFVFQGKPLPLEKC